jgi:hypothetical protein
MDNLPSRKIHPVNSSCRSWLPLMTLFPPSLLWDQLVLGYVYVPLCHIGFDCPLVYTCDSVWGLPRWFMAMVLLNWPALFPHQFSRHCQICLTPSLSLSCCFTKVILISPLPPNQQVPRSSHMSCCSNIYTCFLSAERGRQYGRAAKSMGSGASWTRFKSEVHNILVKLGQATYPLSMVNALFIKQTCSLAWHVGLPWGLKEWLHMKFSCMCTTHIDTYVFVLSFPFLLLFFLAVLGFDLRAWWLLGKCSTTWIMPHSPFCFLLSFIFR